jgi:hypothetical protein
MAKRKVLVAGLWLACVCVVAAHTKAGDDEVVVRGKKLSQWIAQLKTARGNEVITITDAIGAAGPKAVGAVPALLETMPKSAMFRYYANSALGKIGKAAVPTLIEASHGKNTIVANEATSLLRRKYPEDAKKAGLGSIAEEIAAMKKLEPVKELKGTSWYISGAAVSGRTSPAMGVDGSRITTIAFAEGKAKWHSLPFLSRRPGAGEYKLDTSTNPTRIELHVNGKTYKGIYTVTKPQNGFVWMKVQLSAPGGRYPAAMARQFRIPRGSKQTLLRFIRVK